MIVVTGGSEMKILGLVLSAVGVIITLTAMLMPTTADGGEVYNLGLLQHQMMVFTGGLAIVVAGVALTAAGAAVDALQAYARQRPAALQTSDEQISPRRTAPLAALRMSSGERRAQHESADRILYAFLAGLSVILAVVLVTLWAK